jgi:hypothetical protein
MPGTRCTRSLACKNGKHASKSPQVHRLPRHSLRSGFNGLFRALPGDRAFLPPSPARLPEHRRQLDISVEISGPHGFVVRVPCIRPMQGRAHRIPRPTSVTIAIRPSCEVRDGAKD